MPVPVKTLRWLGIVAALLLSACNTDVAYRTNVQAYDATLKGDHEESVRLLRIGAEKGYMVSQFELGYKFQKGNGVPRSYASALQWYAKAAAQGHPTAMNNIGYLLGQGYGTEKKRKGAGLVFKGRQ